MQDIPEGLRPFFLSAELINSAEAWNTALCSCYTHHYPTPIFSEDWERDYAAISELIVYAHSRHAACVERIGKASFDIRETAASF